MLIDIVADMRPELDLYVVSEFPPHRGHWIQYHLQRSFWDNLAKVRGSLRGKRIGLAALVLEPKMPFWPMRLIPVVLAPVQTLFFNENLDHFMLRPGAVPHILRHGLWRLNNLYHWETKPGSSLYTLAWRLRHPREFRRPWLHWRALLAGRRIASRKSSLVAPPPIAARGELRTGISIVIPSRDGRELLAILLPGLVRELAGSASEIVVADNGSTDGTATFLTQEYPQVRVWNRTSRCRLRGRSTVGSTRRNSLKRCC